MNKLGIVWRCVVLLLLASCGKDGEEESERFRLLTGVTWASDSLLVNGEGAGSPGQMLADFRGEARFREDGTGTFGVYEGRWEFAAAETEIIIQSEALSIPLTTRIAELTAASLKVTTAFPNPEVPDEPFMIRMTFKAK